MGLKSKEKDVPQPQVKSIGQLTSEATQANIAQLPLVLDAMKKYGPEFAAAALEQASIANPTLKPLGELIKSRLTDATYGTIPERIRQPFLQNLRASQAARGFVDSPASAFSEAVGLGELGENFTQSAIDEALAYSGITPEGPGLADLGLDLPGGKAAFEANANLEPVRIDTEYNNFALKQKAKQQAAKKKGALIGAAAGGVIGLAGGPIGAIQGYQIGSEMGGTFF